MKSSQNVLIYHIKRCLIIKVIKSTFTSLRLGCLLCFCFVIIYANAQQTLTKINGWNAFVHLPDKYFSTSEKYPAIIFIPGIGEVGTDPNKLLLYGPSRFISQGHDMTFTVNGRKETPIIISMQPSTNWPSAKKIRTQLDSVIKRWRIDPARVYLTGLSMGGWSFDNFITANKSNAVVPTAMVIMAAPESDYPLKNYAWFANAAGKWWGFEGTMDYRKLDLISKTLNETVPGSARYTRYNGGHCCWNTWYDPKWKDTDGESIYTWMLKQRKSGNITLPIEFESFEGERLVNGNLLKWTTSSETNAKQYIVESSSDGIRFAQIGIVPTQSGSGSKHYSFLHNSPSGDLTYYRLKNVDFDENFTYSKIIQIRKLQTTAVKVYPLPASESIWVEISRTVITPLPFRIVSAAGVVVLKGLLTQKKQNIDVSRLSSGIYYIEVEKLGQLKIMIK